MTDPGAKADLQRYLQAARDALVWKLEELSDHDVRRPMTPTGTNLLGLVKHLSHVEAGYFGGAFGRPAPGFPTWSEQQGMALNWDMWATAEESREQIVELYTRAWAHADATIAALPLEPRGQVPWWDGERGAVSLHRLLIHVIAETNRHAGHADIVRDAQKG